MNTTKISLISKQIFMKTEDNKEFYSKWDILSKKKLILSYENFHIMAVFIKYDQRRIRNHFGFPMLIKSLIFMKFTLFWPSKLEIFKAVTECRKKHWFQFIAHILSNSLHEKFDNPKGSSFCCSIFHFVISDYRFTEKVRLSFFVS